MSGTAPHIPVLLTPLLQAVAPVEGVWVDGTFGAGGYARGLIGAGASKVIGIDRDPLAHEMAAPWLPDYGGKIELRLGTFSDLDILAGEKVDGVVLDLGVSSMQLDQAERGFSFQKDGPLDMRMSQEGPSAADLVNTASDEQIADILYLFGEERASRRIARAIVAARELEPFRTTLQLASVIAKQLPRPKPHESHPATRSFQAIRIAVNAEFDQLAEGLAAAERALKPGGRLAVVTFHSLEDRIAKRFFQLASGSEPAANRYAPAKAMVEPRFRLLSKKAISASEEELALNPRSRSAKLRVGIRTEAAAIAADAAALGLPRPERKGRN
ncbi:16S rRNA (cytosine(1402)-N(4))-methyltransferase RsmH [Pseudogemmobacter faecipullorum]|uniref:Ribosomal RNA small subunit methyltransferase H n=1 Tax=Pseudogemmobacter faecipullorum TaxID=2755041 RepID=A0ABS8CLN7_9RHOB|nr:16S rRNA (cytosine(1402)-N(4))-methyltransferase RsmH [Pseudogemmobacter faecipullorum]MCB5410115.1 16S rRNA (cytosine(1402)-N(4))-methyltransferase RsmH [Pseudogemmobacter faecipullorum]